MINKFNYKEPRNSCLDVFKSIYIPIEMCQSVLSNRLCRSFQLFVYLKFVCSGAIKIRNKDLGLIAFDLKIKSTKTVKKHLQILVEKNWLGYIPSSHTYVVRGFEKIRMMEGFKTRSAAEFCFCDMDKFKAFLAGALISYLVNFQKRQERECERVNKCRSNHHSHNFLPFYPIANLA